MEIRKLDKWEEWFESDRIIGTAFLHGWNEKEAEEKFRKQGSGEEERNEEAWGLYDDEGHMQTSFVTTTRKVMFEQCEIPISEVNMVASLPEYRAAFSETSSDLGDKNDSIECANASSAVDTVCSSFIVTVNLGHTNERRG